MARFPHRLHLRFESSLRPATGDLSLRRGWPRACSGVASAALLTLVAGAAIACGGSHANAVEHAGASRCPTGADLRAKFRPPFLRADVDGDGRLDSSRLIVVSTAPYRCRYLLATRTSSGFFFASPVRNPYLPPVPAPGSGLPSLDAAPEISPDGKASLLVRVSQGASLSGGVLYHFANRSFQPIVLRDTHQRLLFYNPPATEIDGVDCLGRRRGRIVQLRGGEIGSSGKRWSIQRIFFRLQGRVLTRTGESSTIFRGPLERLVRVLPAGFDRPFPSCR